MLSQFDRRSKKFVCDLAGSGAIGLAIAQERNDVEVYLVEKSAEALKVASANLAGLGNHAVKVKRYIVVGSMSSLENFGTFISPDCFKSSLYS